MTARGGRRITPLDRRVVARFPVGMEFRPTLEVRQVAGRVRLLLGSMAYGEGATLQEAADGDIRQRLFG